MVSLSSTMTMVRFFLSILQLTGSIHRKNHSHRSYLVRKGFLINLAKFTGKACARVSFINCRPQPATLLRKRLWSRCFPANLVKFLRNVFFKEHLWGTASAHQSAQKPRVPIFDKTDD